MSGSKEQQKAEKLVKKQRWGKIGKMLEKGDAETRLAVASELGNASDENALNYLISLLKDPDERVQVQAVKSIGTRGEERAKAFLQNMISTLPSEKVELHDAIRDSISKINVAEEANKDKV